MFHVLFFQKELFHYIFRLQRFEIVSLYLFYKQSQSNIETNLISSGFLQTHPSEDSRYTLNSLPVDTNSSK